MALIKCPECDHAVSPRAKSCPKCGFGVRSTELKKTFSRWTILLLFFLLAALLMPKREKPARPVSQPIEDLSSGITLKDVGFMQTVIARNGTWRRVKFFLNQKVAKAELQSIALKIKNDDPNFYEQTLIDYLLPGSTDSWSWATTHFNPGLEVKILGLTIEEENRLVNDPKSPPGEIIGVWLLDAAFISRKLTVYSQNGQLKMERKYSDLSSDSQGITKRTSLSGLIFEKKVGPDSTDYYLVNENGNLELRDKDGLVATAMKIL